MKRFSIIIVLLTVFVFAGCGRAPAMDQPTADGNYHYSNQDFDFSLTLPPEFIYYQTQRVGGENFVDIEFYVPTSDTKYPTAVSGYAGLFKVRMLSSLAEEEAIKKYEDIDFYQIGKKKNFSYLIKFWDHVPSDWIDRWGDGIKEGIIDSFELK